MSSEWNEHDPDGAIRCRIDFDIQVLEKDEATRTVQFKVTPSPKRYSKIEIDNKSYFFDKFLMTAIPEDEIHKMALEQMNGLPMFSNPATIDHTPTYANTRKNALNAELNGANYQMPPEKAVSQPPFQSVGEARLLTFLSVDICGSTLLRRKNENLFDRAYSIFFRELATLVGQFGGNILKATGDGFIAYIDFPAFTTQCDNTIDLGISLHVLLQKSINPALEAAGLPTLEIRVGADCGNALIREIFVPTIKYSTTEVASDALNRCVKIEKSADANEFRIGRCLYELVHVQWLERCTEVSNSEEATGLPNYRIYRVQ